MPRGVTQTTRGTGAGDWPAEQSLVAKRNATEADLEMARAAYVGKFVPLTTATNKRSVPASYRCAGVRLDSLRRLIFDLVRNDSEG